MGKNKNIVPVLVKSSEEIRAIAKAFYQSSKILGTVGGEFWDIENMNQDEMDKNINIKCALPKIVLRALSAEIALKAYTFQDGFVCEGHNLYEIFVNVEEEKRNEIKIQTMLNIQKMYPNRRYNEKEFEIDLLSISKVFVDWRYIYEKDEYELDYEFLDAFTNSLF